MLFHKLFYKLFLYCLNLETNYKHKLICMKFSDVPLQEDLGDFTLENSTSYSCMVLNLGFNKILPYINFSFL